MRVTVKQPVYLPSGSVESVTDKFNIQTRASKIAISCGYFGAGPCPDRRVNEAIGEAISTISLNEARVGWTDAAGSTANFVQVLRIAIPQRVSFFAGAPPWKLRKLISEMQIL